MSTAKKPRKSKAVEPEVEASPKTEAPAMSSKKSRRDGKGADDVVKEIASATDAPRPPKEAQPSSAKKRSKKAHVKADGEAAETALSDGLVVLNDQRAALLHCCRPVFYQPSGFSNSSNGDSWGLTRNESRVGGFTSESVLLCAYGDGVRGAAVRSGAWLWALDNNNITDSSSEETSNSSLKRKSLEQGNTAAATTTALVNKSVEQWQARVGVDDDVTAVACSADGIHVVMGTSSGKLSTFTHLGAWAAERARQLDAKAGENDSSRAGAAASAAAAAAKGLGAGRLGTSEFVLTGEANAGAPVLSLAAPPTGAKRIYAVLGMRTGSKIDSTGVSPAADSSTGVSGKEQDKEKDDGEDTEGAAAAGASKGKDTNTKAPKPKGWSVAVVTIGVPKSINRKHAPPSLRTVMRIDPIYASRHPIYGLTLLPAPEAAASESTEAGALFSPDVVLATSKEIVVLPADLRASIPTASPGVEAFVGVPSPKPKHVPYADPTNPAWCVASQPQPPGSSSSSSLGVATGHAGGQIYVWYGLLDRNASHFELLGKKKKSSKPPPFKGIESKTQGGATAVAAPTGVRRLAPLHWHAAGCTALAWGQGGCLLSGGHEGVLLVWRLQVQGGSGGGGGAAGKPAFLPRLGGTVLHLALSPDHTAATVSTSNNVVRLVSLADRERRWALRGVSTVLAGHQSSHTIGYNNTGTKNICNSGNNSTSNKSSGPRLCLLAAEPPQVVTTSTSSALTAAAAAVNPADADVSSSSRSCRLVVNGHPGALQWFDALYDKVNDVALDVVPHNFNAAAHHLLRDNNDHRSGSSHQPDVFPVPRVFLAAFGGGGQLLITVDGWTPLSPSSLSSSGHQGGSGEGAGDGSGSKRSQKADVASAIVRNRFSAQAPVETTTRPNLKFWTKASKNNSGQGHSSSSSSSSSSNTSGSSSAGWRLNSTLGSPHGSSPVTALACHPSPSHGMAATGAEDGSLKVWRLQTRAEAAAATAANAVGGAKHSGERPSRAAAVAAAGQGEGSNHNNEGPGGGGPSSFWVCAASGGWRDGASVTSLALSPDGSVLAAGHACAATATMARAAARNGGGHNNSNNSGCRAGAGLVTLWDPAAELVLLATLVLPGSAQPMAYPPCNLAETAHGGSAPHLLAFMSPGNEDAHARVASAAAAAAAAKAGGGVANGGKSNGVVTQSPSDASATSRSSGAHKLAVCRSTGVGVWDLATLRCDWHLGIACDAAAVLPTGARPFVVCAPASSAGAAESAPVRVATLAVAVRGAFDDFEGENEARPLRTCVALFGCGSSVPAYVFDLGLNFGAVASIQWVVSPSGYPLGVAVVAENSQQVRLLQLQPQGSASFLAAAHAATGSSAAATDAAAAELEAKKQQQKRLLALAAPAPRPRVLPLPNVKRVKFSEPLQAAAAAAITNGASHNAGNNGVGDAAANTTNPLAAAGAAAAAASLTSGADFLSRVPSGDLPPPSELFAAFLRAVPPPASSPPAAPVASSPEAPKKPTERTTTSGDGGLFDLGLGAAPGAATGAADSDDDSDQDEVSSNTKQQNNAGKEAAVKSSANARQPQASSVAMAATSSAEMEAWLGFFAKKLSEK